MKCNVYDFDRTIYGGDSTLDFYKFALKKYPLGMLTFPFVLFACFLYILNKYSKTQFKEKFFSFLIFIPDIDNTVIDFWKSHKKKIKNWYLNKCKDSDIIISASPEFLLYPICKELKVKLLIASIVDKKTGKICGNNCYGEEKVNRLKNELQDCIIVEFYSDSISDQFLAKTAEQSYLVCGDEIMSWDCIRKSKTQRVRALLLKKRLLGKF